MQFLLYLVTNKANKKQYIGITTRTVALRWYRHCLSAKLGSKIPLHTAIHQYGESSFAVSEIAQAKSYKNLQKAERAAIAHWGTYAPSGYNCTLGGQGSLGFKFTPEQLKRLSESHMGQPRSEETRRKIAIASTGRKHSKKTLQLMARLSKERLDNNPSHRKAFIEGMLAYAKSPENRARAAKMAREHPAIIAGRNQTGRRRSESSKAKMSVARSAFFAKSEHRQRKGGIPVEYVADIKALLLTRNYTQTALGKRYGVPQSLVWFIKEGKCWADVAPAPIAEAEARFADTSWEPTRIQESLAYSSHSSAVDSRARKKKRVPQCASC